MAYAKPPQEVVRIARILAYPDFPTQKDILAICKIESDYRAEAVNPEKGIPSVGIMQVRNGPMVVWQNMSLGVAQLRYNYRVLHNREAAVKAYNVGIRGYRQKLAPTAAEIYWGKFVKAKEGLN